MIFYRERDRFMLAFFNISTLSLFSNNSFVSLIESGIETIRKKITSKGKTINSIK
jgi:hypothetical protein